jgi:outer membrane protein TolC
MKFFTLLLTATTLFASMSVEDAWRLVESKNGGMQAASNDMKAAKLKQNSAKSMYLPKISLTANYTHLDKPIDLDTSGISQLMASLPVPLPFPSSLDLSKQDIFLADLQMLWPLYVGGKIDAAQDIYSAKLNEAKAMLEMKKDKEFLKLVKYYYGAVISEALYKTRVEALKALQLHYENAQKLSAQGQIAKVELLNAEVKRDAAKIACDKAADSLAITKRALELLTHSNEKVSSSLFIYAENKNFTYFEDALEKKSTALSLFDAKSKQTKSLVAIKEAAFKPEVVGYANYNLYRDNSLLMQSLPNWFAGVILKFNLLDRKDRKEEIEIAKLQNAKVSALKKEALENLRILLEKSYKEMLSSLKEYKALDSSLSLAEQNYKLRSLSFKEGLATSSDVVDAQLFLESIKTKRLNAAYNYVLKLSQLLVLSGEREKFFIIAKKAEILE